MKTANSRICAIVAIALAAGVSACDKKVGANAGANKGARTALAPEPSSQVIGKMPAEPSGDPPGTTAVSQSTEVSKQVESSSMPLPGQPNDHSNVAPLPSQKAETEGVLKSTEAAKQANNEPEAGGRSKQ